jgi:hypothetical protein
LYPYLIFLQNLKEYKLQYGDCRVPLDHPELGKWAKYQRDHFSAFQKGRPSKMTKKKFELLESIGFEESIDEAVDNFGGETTSVAAASMTDAEEQTKRRSAASKMDESQFAGGLVAHPNVYVNHAGQHQYAEHLFHSGGQGMGQAYDAYAQHPSYQQGYGGHSY